MIALLLGLAGAAPLAPGPHLMVVDVASRSEMAYAGKTEVITRSLLRVDVIRRADGSLEQVQRVCAVRMSSDSKALTEIPDAFVASLPEQRYPVAVQAGPDGEQRYTADPGPSEVGFDPAVTGGELPQRKGDPGVTDPDGDGHPGVTVRLIVPVIGAVRIYIAQRGHSRYVGRVIGGEVRGDVEIVTMEQRTLGASFAPFAANPTIVAVPERSRFRLAPLETAEGCEELVARWDGGFGIGGSGGA